MDRHFALPIVLAAALHAGLLLWNSPSTPVKAPDKEPGPLDPIKTIFEIVIASPEVAEDKTEPAKGSPNEERVITPEPPVTAPREPHFPLVIPAVKPTNPTREITKISEPPGVEGGSVRGVLDGLSSIVNGVDLDSPPRTRVQVPPPFPYDKRKEGIPGEVLVEFTVDEAGVVLSPRIVRSSDRAFEEPTLRAIAKWRFEPGKRQGRIVPFRMAVPILFKLDND